MSGTTTAPAGATRRVRLELGTTAFDTFQEVEIVRDLGEFCGGFSLTVWEPARSRAFLGGVSSIEETAGVTLGQAATLKIDGETVLVGWVEEILLETRGDDLVCRIYGRDKAGDLVDCAAAPNGPAEFVNLTLTEIVERLARPFGLTVRAEVPVGDRFPRFGLEPDELAFDAIERACRQRAILCVSDGIGGLVLTRGGQTRGPAALRLGESILESQVRLSWRERFSEILVKGQTERAGGNRRAAPGQNGTAQPLGPTAPIPAPPREAAGVLMTGRASDPVVNRYRPRVVLAPSQSGGASVQEQADWHVRIQRGRSTMPVYTVQDWRAGQDRRLWRPNEIVEVDDRFAALLEEMLVVGVSWIWDDNGARTQLRVAGRTAFDRISEGEERQSLRVRVEGRALNGTAQPLSVRT